MTKTDAKNEEEPFRTTLTIPMDVIEKVDDLHHEAMKRGEVSRNLGRNPFMAKLLEDKVNELYAEREKEKDRKAGSAKKRSTT